MSPPTLELALQASGLHEAKPAQRPRLLSDNGSSYIAGYLAKWLDNRKIKHLRGAPYHPMTQGKIERWHQTLKNYHESIDNLTPADVYFGRGPTILAERERIKRQTIAERRLQHQLSSLRSSLRWAKPSLILASSLSQIL